MRELCKKGLAQLAELLKGRKISSVELTREYLAEIEERDPSINSFVTLCPEAAMEAAKAADARLARGEGATALTGVPIAIKDIFVTKGVRTTCCSRILENYVPPYDGTVVAKLKASGAVMTGKLSMDEFAMGSSNEFSAFGPVKNPWDRSLTPGGSSGGSAAAVAAGLTPVSLGTDTGGSVRQPAAFCGVVGLKPTYGRISRYGIIAFASSLDQVGPMARDVRDCAAMLGAVAGHDELDATTIPAPVPDYAASLTGDVRGKTVGVPREYFVEGIDPEVESAVRAASDVLARLGAKVIDISLPHTRYSLACYYIIAPAEASANLARYDGVRYGHGSRNAKDLDALFSDSRTEGFGPEVALRIVLGTYVLSSGYYDAYYLKARKARTLIKGDFLEAFKECDAIIAPVTPTPPFRLGEKIDDPIRMYLNDIFTIPVNLAGLPGLSMPCGVTKSALPIGMQLIGRPLEEAELLNMAYAYERATEWHTKVPVED
ncbi:MAG: Asp-tRNA(Asn)/Glu-tRNA(Gln) amidotransferase subunit GatA [Proteobacteria bacterium]|nr:Asp-tRNA(Asn)/Glu-tRNA(Gln) amidotransferase subunit GatA [Pseudomonadota bacterium]